MDTYNKSHLFGLVDMGSNGIRFSITDLSPPTARLLPTIYTSRSAISLYDAQFPLGATASSPSPSSDSRQPIPSTTISSVISALKRFKAVCRDFGVPEANIKILATEATRTARNAGEFLGRIKEELGEGREVTVLEKEEEGRIGAWGIASGFEVVEGLVLDLGGGSCQITWMVAKNGEMQTSPIGSVSFPFGAAALTRLLADPPTVEEPREQLAAEIQAKFREACKVLEIPSELLQSNKEESGSESDGLTLYLSGGGFRGWGYLLMSQSPNSPYPIPMINGFSTHIDEFQSTKSVEAVAAGAAEDGGGGGSIFRISKRRASQVPAVAFLVQNLVKALEETTTTSTTTAGVKKIPVKQVRFCQGGVREGYLFNLLSRDVRAQDPLLAATASHAPPSAKKIADLIRSALPEPVRQNGGGGVPSCCRPSMIQALANAMYLHASHAKESASAAALYSTTHGPLAAAHGVSHRDRAGLALMLCERWGAELPPTDEEFRSRLAKLISPEWQGEGLWRWWSKYVGRVAALVGDVYPAGVMTAAAAPTQQDGKGERISFQAELVEGGIGKRRDERGVRLVIKVQKDDPITSDDALADRLEEIQKLGKKKNWFGRNAGCGMRVEVELRREDC